MEEDLSINEKRVREMVDHDRLRRARDRKRLTQAELATRVGLSERQISDRENKDGIMNSNSLVAIARELEVSIDWLCGLTGSDELHGHLQRALTPEENRLLVALREMDLSAVIEVFALRFATRVTESADELIAELRKRKPKD